ncbi:methyl-accepting chemotaxis protein [Verrucomicrobium sp. GAS474]|uniref:HAMP domain-containing methyl-accepting chemotaxis protein n=1 Tax=Verrucomicrobium sp. GAS474 TaxID=1882831 RepID=UPI00087AA0D4|nr:methyl-accepting chemotaxis protein [Verrucomicrobium sp. GAS474]SDU01750.1 methyl-accepting chemotaxis protein [Verrucomicrobium sp. GAS474]
MKNSDWTIGKRILVGCALLILINTVVGIFSCISISKLKSHTESIVTNWIPGINDAGAINAEIRTLNRLILQHILADTPEAKAKVETTFKTQLELVDKLVKDYGQSIDPEERELYAAMTRTVAAYIAQAKVVEGLSAAGQAKEAHETFDQQIVPLYAAARDAVVAENKYNQKGADVEGAETTSLAKFAFAAVASSVVIAFVVGLLTAFLNIRSITTALNAVSSSINDGSAQVASAAGQVSSNSQSLADGASEQAASLEETSASLEEISSMTQRNAESAQSAQALSGQARAAAETGALRTGEMQQEMAAIRQASDEMGAAIADIRASGNNVSKIIKTIDEIAFQTNILALNAAVEAARAGEAGAGFAVVAEEVRSLAQRSADAAKETAQMIEASVAQSARGVEVNQRVAVRVASIAEKSAGVRVSLDEIVTKVREVDALVSSIASASKEQTEGIGQVTKAVSAMDKVTQSNAAGAEETASAAQQLDTQSQELSAAVDILARLVNGSGGQAPSPASARIAPSAPRARVTASRTALQGSSRDNAFRNM